MGQAQWAEPLGQPNGRGSVGPVNGPGPLGRSIGSSLTAGPIEPSPLVLKTDLCSGIRAETS